MKGVTPFKFCIPCSQTQILKRFANQKGIFLLSVLKSNFYRHIKSTEISSDISKMSSSILIHFLIWFIIETKHRLGIQHRAVKEGARIHICTASLSLHCFSTIPKPCGSRHLQNSGVFLLKTIIKEAMKEISIHTFLALLTDFINHSQAYAAR